MSEQQRSEKIYANIGTCDKNSTRIQVGDIIRYYAGSKRQIEQLYLVTNQPYPDIFQGFDSQFGNLKENWYVRLLELETWGEITGHVGDTPEEQERVSREVGMR